MRTADGSIVRRCLDGDSAAFGFLVDRYRAAVYALAYSRLGDFHDAEDVAQEAFIKAYKNLRTLRRWDNFHAWLCAITINKDPTGYIHEGLHTPMYLYRTGHAWIQFVIDPEPAENPGLS